MLNLFKKIFPNDVRKIDEEAVHTELSKNARLSYTFVVLLMCSGVVATLGLLINSVPIIIGGMIISPLVYPLLKISLDLSSGRAMGTLKSFGVLFASILIIVCGAFLITSYSPIKLINEEIIARTNPTLLDVIIALASGTVAVFGTTQTKVSQALAGVAISTSLLPPLSVIGIGIALGEPEIFLGSSWLFVSNVVAIIFAGVMTFALMGSGRMGGKRRGLRGVIIVTAALVATSVPMWYFLLNYSFETQVYSQTQTVLEKSLDKISPSIYLGNIKTSLDSSQDVIEIDADLELPENTLINYEQQQKIKSSLEEAFGKKVDLKLHLSNTISIVSPEDIEIENTRQLIEDTLVEEVGSLSSTLSIKSISSVREEDIWRVSSIVYAQVGTTLTQKEYQEIEMDLNDLVNQKVELNLEIITLTSLKPEETEEQKTIAGLSKEIEKNFVEISEGTEAKIEVMSVSVTNFDQQNIVVQVEIKIPYWFELREDTVFEIKNDLQNKYQKNITIMVEKTYKDEVVF